MVQLVIPADLVDVVVHVANFNLVRFIDLVIQPEEQPVLVETAGLPPFRVIEIKEQFVSHNVGE